MNVYLENQKEIVCLMPCLYQFDANAPFTQAVLGFTDNDFIFYNDYKPDKKIVNKGYSYNIKAKFPLKNIAYIVDEVIDSSDLAYVNELKFVSNNPDDSFNVYYLKKDKRMVNIFLNALENRGFKITKSKAVIESVL